MSDLTAVVFDAGELVVGPGPAAAEPQPDLERYEGGAVAVVDGRVAAAGPTASVTREYPPENAAHAVDAAGKAVVPGFVDAHTHGLFAGDRSDEFAAKLRGASYQDILAEGGGILRTVDAVRAADAETLLSNLLGHLDVMLAHGTTTVEVKSGYGLDTETELRMLAVMERADAAHPVDVVPTFMGAHAVPEGRSAAAYTEEVIDEQLPAVADQGIAEFCDVFAEEGVFTIEQSRRVLAAGRDYGLTPKVHAEELSHLGGTQLAAEVEAASADHLLHATADDIDALAAAGVTPVLLPGTAFGLGAEYPDAERFLAAGAPPAVATDFNPNCHSQNMGFALSLACVACGLSPAAALLGGTTSGARAVDRADRGTLTAGARGDVVVLDAPTHVHVPYSHGVNRVESVLKGGVPVYGPAASERGSRDREGQP